MADFDVQGKITFDATQAQTSLKQTASSADQAAVSTAKVGEAAKTAQPQIGQFGSALGLAGQAVGQLVPGLGQVVTVAGSATGVIQGLTTAGLGPLGLAIGVVSVAVTAGVKLWQDYKDEQERTEESIRNKVLPTLANLKKAFEDAAQAALDEEAIQRRVAARTASASDYAATITRLTGTQNQLRAEQEQLMGKRTADMTAADMRRLSELQGLIADGERNLAQLQENFRRQVPAESEDARLREQNAQRLRAIQAEIEAAGETLGGDGQPRRTGGGGGRRATAAEAQATTPMGYDSEAAQQELARLEADMAAEADVRRMMRELEIEEQNAAKDRSIEIATQLNEERARLEKERMDEQMRLSEEQAAKMEEINDAVFSALESAFSSSVSAWLDGSKSISQATRDMVRDVARSLTGEAIVQGLKETALGIGALAVGSPSAAVHFAAAGKWAAIGVAAGAVGAASGAFGGAGGGGGAPAAATGGPALTPGASEGAGTTVVINWGSSGLVYAADRAQLGRDIAGMIGEAHGRLGRGM